MSLGLVVLEKLFTRTRMPTPQSDDIKIDHVVAVEIVAEQHIATKYSKCNGLRVISHIIILGKVLLVTQK